MNAVTRRRYTAEFKAQAVGLVAFGTPGSEVAEDLGIGSSFLYGWMRKNCFYHAGKPTVTQMADVGLGDLIDTGFIRHRCRYGYRRLAHEQANNGVICARARIRRLMAMRALDAIQPKNCIPKTCDGRAYKPSPNLLSDQPSPPAREHDWARDLTFIPTNAGWLYLAVVIELCSRRIVGWSLADPMRSDLALGSLNQALQTRTVKRTIFHSNRGSQFRKTLAKAGLCPSMSARANPYDNTRTESLISTLKRKMLQGGCFKNADDASTEIFEYIKATAILTANTPPSDTKSLTSSRSKSPQ